MPRWRLLLQVDALHALMLERMDEEDAGFLLATTATSARMLAQAHTRAALLAHPEVAARFAELLQHPSREVGGLGPWVQPRLAAAEGLWVG